MRLSRAGAPKVLEGGVGQAGEKPRYAGWERDDLSLDASAQRRPNVLLDGFICAPGMGELRKPESSAVSEDKQTPDGACIPAGVDGRWRRTGERL